jgi:hypothetical protein
MHMRKLNNFDKVLGILIVIAILLLATKAIALGEDRQRTCLAETHIFYK